MKYGLLLSDINQGSSNQLWASMASMFPSDGEDLLFVFPGGKISKTGPDSMRNQVFNVAYNMNLDGCVAWTSSLSGNVGIEEVFRNLKPIIEKIPFVSIAGRSSEYPKIPVVNFDAYTGMYSLIEHCIEKHGAEKIVFIRGPVNHASAEDRYRAYRDVLKNHDIEFNERLVSSPVMWSEGYSAIKQIIAERKIVPKVDFDTVICASDLLMYGAERCLFDEGFTIPDDVRICGFNDTERSRVLRVPATTVKLPYARLGVEAVRSMRKKVSGGMTVSDVLLPTKPVLRRSCGCGTEVLANRFADTSEYAKYISETFSLDIVETQRLINDAIAGKTNSSTKDYVEFLCGGSLDLFGVSLALDMFPESEKSIGEKAKSLLPEVLDRINTQRNFEQLEIYSRINSFKCNLLNLNTVDEIKKLLKNSAGDLGFIDCILSVGEEDSIQKISSPGVYVVEPLFIQSEYLGYLIFKTDKFSGDVCEDLRSCVSSAVKRAVLYDSLRKSEQDKTEMLLWLGNNIRTHENIQDVIKLADIALSMNGSISPEMKFGDFEEFLISMDCNVLNRIPYMMFDAKILSEVFKEANEQVTVKAEKNGVKIDFASDMNNNNFTESAILIHGGKKVGTEGSVSMIFPYPTYSGKPCVTDYTEPIEIDFSDGEKVRTFMSDIAKNQNLKRAPLFCIGCPVSDSVEQAFEKALPFEKRIICCGLNAVEFAKRFEATTTDECQIDNLVGTCKKVKPDLLIISDENEESDGSVFADVIAEIRNNRKTAYLPVVLCVETITRQLVLKTADFPNLILCNPFMFDTEGFVSRIKSILLGSDILPTMTGSIVKNAQAFICLHSCDVINRWQIAETVNVNEDYLARIFKKETGISPWDYLTRYRIDFACKLLNRGPESFNEIAKATGFKDQAYFCRVFKKVKGYTPGQQRNKKSQ